MHNAGFLLKIRISINSARQLLMSELGGYKLRKDNAKWILQKWKIKYKLVEQISKWVKLVIVMDRKRSEQRKKGKAHQLQNVFNERLNDYIMYD